MKLNFHTSIQLFFCSCHCNDFTCIRTGNVCALRSVPFYKGIHRTREKGEKNGNWFHVIKKHFQFNTHSLFSKQKVFFLYFIRVVIKKKLLCLIWKRMFGASGKLERNRLQNFKHSFNVLAFRKNKNFNRKKPETSFAWCTITTLRHY